MTSKPPLSLDIYDHRNIVLRIGDEQVPFVQGIHFEVSAIDTPVLEVSLPELGRDDLTEEQGKKLASIIETLQSYGVRIVFKPLSEITPESDPKEQSLAESTLKQILTK